MTSWRVLALDTCGALGSVALAEVAAESVVVLAESTLPGRMAGERLIRAIEELLAGHGVAPGEIAAVVVVHGPGSFTGVRVGLSAAKGLCEGLGVPLVAVSRLEVLAALATGAGGAAGRIRAVIDAGRGEFYCGEFQGEERLRETLMTFDDVARLAGELVAYEPNVAQAFEAASPAQVREPSAADALGIAARRLRAGAFDDIATVDANYVRRTDAEIFARPVASLRP